MIKRNWFVLHLINGEVDGSWVFHEELDEAINFIHDYCDELLEYCDEVMEVAHHIFYVCDKGKLDCVAYRHEFEIVREEA